MKLFSRTLLICSALFVAPVAFCSNQISGGVWFNYENVKHDKDSNGNLGNEAFVLYADGKADKDKGNWSYSAELRVGPGSFTDVDNNSTGDNVTLHKAWIGFDLSENNKILIGKSQVPFGWKTINFWPGDMLEAGYGDQMDTGVKLISSVKGVDVNLAYFLADDWGKTSTDTTDDNRHWGSSTSYRKIKTGVVDVQYPLTEHQRIGASIQSGKLEDLISNQADGKHSAWALYYLGQFGNFYTKAEYIDAQRTLPESYVQQQNLTVSEIKNQRLAFEMGYKWDEWNFYVDMTQAKPDTEGSTADTVTAWAPGITYNYGPGWIYLEYLDQNGYVDRNGQVFEGDFAATYLSFDFYF
ncbi:hypothetical protein SOPP22_18860 [Shewanella sp. OPT22]|nr:hypothetical protein SOPP22_18860 [Shewanella sp. OPT22]